MRLNNKKLMKKTLITLLFPIYAFAQTEVKSYANLESVTVYTRGAELTHKGKINLNSGVSEVHVNNIAGSLNENSIQVGFPTGVTVLSVQYNKDFLNKEIETPAIKKISDSLRVANTVLLKIQREKQTENQVLALLNDNRNAGGANTGINVLELTKLTTYFKSKYAETNENIAKLTAKENEQLVKVKALEAQLNEIKNSNNYQLGQIILKVLADKNTLADYEISYISNNASWKSSYDLKALNIRSPILLGYKAAITQNTGLDWKKIKLSLSTGSPSSNLVVPTLNPMYVSVAPDYSGIRKQESDLLSEVAVMAYSAKSAAPRSISNFIASTESQLALQYNIALPYDIYSNNKPQAVFLKEEQLPATYKYFAAPRISNDAYLLADIKDWQNLNLLVGEANIVFEGTYTGKSYINPSIINDTLSLGIGKDKKIIISKEKLNDFSSTKFIGNNKRQTFTYEIKIRNTKKENIDILLKDQYPVSKESDIEVELTESSKAKVNKDTGILSWDLKISPGETRVIKIAYVIKSPKNKSLAGI